MIFSKYILLLTVSYFTGALSSLDCSWDSTTQNIDCPYHTYVDRKTGKLQTVQYTTAPFTRPLSKEDKNTYYKHDDSRKDNNGTASFSYFFNIGGNVPMDDTLKKDGCATTTGSDPNDPLSGPAAGFQKDDNRDFKCHRIAGDITKSENVVVGPIEQDDPAKGFYMTVKGGDDCKDTWRSQSGGYYKRSLTIRVFCDTSSDAVGNVPDVETVREDLTCMYSLDVYSSHGCPKSCPRVTGSFSGGGDGKFGTTCNGPAGSCVSGAISTGADGKATVGEPTCVCDSNEGWTGPKCDKKCPRDAKTGETKCLNGHCAYDPIVDAGRCFCNAGYSGTHCEVESNEPSKSSKIVGLDGGTVFGWILVVFAIFGLIGFFIYHKKGSSSGATDYGHLGTI